MEKCATTWYFYSKKRYLKRWVKSYFIMTFNIKWMIPNKDGKSQIIDQSPLIRTHIAIACMYSFFSIYMIIDQSLDQNWYHINPSLVLE